MKYKKFFRAFINNLSSNEYRNYRDNLEKDAIKIPSLEKQNKILFNDVNINSLDIFDTLDNKGINKLIKRLYRLSSNKYKKIIMYKKSSLFKKYSYIGIKYGTNSCGIIAEIVFLKDEFISNLDIHYTCVDDFRWLIEYKFRFKSNLSKKYYDFLIYNSSKKIYKNFSFCLNSAKLTMDQIHSYTDYIIKNGLIIFCQHFIVNKLYTKNGRHNYLPSIDYNFSSCCFDFSKFQNNFLQSSFINIKDNYVITRPFTGEYDYHLFAAKNSNINLSISKYIMNYGIEFYYLFLGIYELEMIKNTYRNSMALTKNISNDDVRNLYNKLFSIKEYKNRNVLENDFNKKWVYLNSDNVQKDFSCIPLYNFHDFYNKYYRYFKNLFESQNNKFSLKLSVVALIISTLAFIASFVFSLLTFLKK